MGGKKKNRAKTNRPEEAEPLDVLGPLPPLKDFGDLDAWAKAGESELLVGKAVTVRPGDIGGEAERPKHYGKMAIGLFVLLCVVACVAGFIDRTELPTLIMKRVSQSRGRQTQLVESRDGKVVMLETSGDTSQVVVEVSGQASWLLVSRDDTTAASPTLSPNSEWLAYVTRRDGGGVEIVSIITDTTCITDARRVIDADMIQDAGKIIGVDGMVLCPWTPIAWSATNDRIAFFACARDASVSMAVVGDLSDSTIPLTACGPSKAESSDTRRISWIDEMQIVVSMPETDRQQSTVAMFEVP